MYAKYSKHLFLEAWIYAYSHIISQVCLFSSGLKFISFNFRQALCMCYKDVIRGSGIICEKKSFLSNQNFVLEK